MGNRLTQAAWGACESDHTEQNTRPIAQKAQPATIGRSRAAEKRGFTMRSCWINMVNKQLTVRARSAPFQHIECRNGNLS